jgi:hypothetical protein
MTIHRVTDIDPFSVRVSAYRNLRAGGWSVKTAERVGAVPKGKVIAHADQCAITDAVFEVNTTMLAATVAGTGRRGHRRNVFAWVTGGCGATVLNIHTGQPYRQFSPILGHKR